MLVGLGNNINGALSTSSIPVHSTPVSQSHDGAVLFHGWSCSVVLEYKNNRIRAWGRDPLVSSLDQWALPTSPPSPLVQGLKVLTQHDRPAAVLAGGKVYLPPTCHSSLPVDSSAPAVAPFGPPGWYQGANWDDAGVTDLGPAVGFCRERGLYRFPDLEHLCADKNGSRVEHPFLTANTDVQVYATEARVLLLVHGHVLELDVKNDTSRPPLTVVDEMEGLGVTQLIPGPGNRFGAVTQAGEGYLLGPHDVEAVVIGPGEDEDEDEEGDGIAAMALGYEFDIVLSCGTVYARGNNEFGQLGQRPTTKWLKTWTRVDVDGVTAVCAGRFSTLLAKAW